jgi:hypothetical protein
MQQFAPLSLLVTKTWPRNGSIVAFFAEKRELMSARGSRWWCAQGDSDCDQDPSGSGQTTALTSTKFRESFRPVQRGPLELQNKDSVRVLWKKLFHPWVKLSPSHHVFKNIPLSGGGEVVVDNTTFDMSGHVYYVIRLIDTHPPTHTHTHTHTCTKTTHTWLLLTHSKPKTRSYVNVVITRHKTAIECDESRRKWRRRRSEEERGH